MSIRTSPGFGFTQQLKNTRFQHTNLQRSNRGSGMVGPWRKGSSPVMSNQRQFWMLNLAKIMPKNHLNSLEHSLIIDRNYPTNIPKYISKDQELLVHGFIVSHVTHLHKRRYHIWCQIMVDTSEITMFANELPSRSLTVRSWKVIFPIGKDRIPTIHFQV